jgi:hypothetical protein
MDIQVTLFGRQQPITDAAAPDAEAQRDPLTPPELLRQREWVFQHIPVWMRTYNIGQLALSLKPAGAVPTADIQWAPLPDVDDAQDVPPLLVDIRPDIIRMLRIIFERFCISTFAIVLTADEMDELRTYWRYLQTGASEDAEALRYRNVPLQREQDPRPQEVAETDEQGTNNQEERVSPPEFEQ